MRQKLKRLKEKIQLLKDNSQVSENMVLIRQFTPEQVTILDEWTSKRAMSFNLSFGFLALFISSYVFLLDSSRKLGIFLMIFSFISSGVLLIRSYSYDYWWKLELKLIVEKFKLNNISLGDKVTKN